MSQDRSAEITAVLSRIPAKIGEIRNELKKRILGQDGLIDEILTALLARGHCLLIGVPGLAKTLLISTLGEIGNLKFKRVQFTPDMMPSDITGSEIIEENHSTGLREFKFVKGPVFTQLLLADEINRTPPKTQAALLEAMQERQVTVSGKYYGLEKPFFVMATQNPIEQEGTYPLPEAQLDRFMFCLNVDYPSFEDETDILLATTQDYLEPMERIISAEELVEMQAAVRQIPVPRSVAEFATRLVRATRPNRDDSPDFVNNYVRWGAGTRACQYLALAGKVFAALDGRLNVATEDIVRASCPVLRHRVIINYRAEADGLSVEQIINELTNALIKQSN
jgi:MoxR-like ATPase